MAALQEPSGCCFDVHAPDPAVAARNQTVLLSSGLGGAAAFWRPQIPALTAAGYRVISYDQRGTGRSRQALPASYSIAHMAQDVLEILDASGSESCHLLGHALGGLVGLELALRAPERLASLLLVNAWSRPNPHTARCFDARLALLEQSGARAYVEAQPIFLYPAAWASAHAEQVAQEVEHAYASFPEQAVLRARIAALRAFDVDARLAEIRVPAWISCAQDDVLVPWSSSQRLAEGLPQAQLALLSHGGHAHCCTEAQAFNAGLLDFLAQLGRS
jgi:aminoacrylate hydrolase